MKTIDEEVERIMQMPEAELRAELSAEGKTMEGVAAEMRLVFERAKAEADMRLAIRAWLKCPAEKRPSAFSLGYRIEQIAIDFTKDELRASTLSNGERQ